MIVEGLEDLPGTPLEPGTICLHREDDEALGHVLGQVTAPGAGLHPLWAYIAPQRGIGTSINALCRLAGYSVDEGPMMGSIELELDGAILPEVKYRVEGEVVDIVRKEGRSVGVFDVLTYRERLVSPEGETVVTATNTFILPRKAQA